MALLDIATALTTRMVDNWNNTDVPIVYPNLPPVDVSGHNTWARFTVDFGQQSQIAMGIDRLTEQLGSVTLEIFVRSGLGLGSGPAYVIAEEFTALFRYYQEHNSDFTITCKTPFIDIDDSDDGWYCLEVRIPVVSRFTVAS